MVGSYFVRQVFDKFTHYWYHVSTMQILNQTVSIREVQRQYKDVVATVQQASQPVIVMNRSQAQLAMINLQQLEEYERLKLFSIFEKIRADNQSVKIQKGLSDITAEVEVVRKQRHARTAGGR